MIFLPEKRLSFLILKNGHPLSLEASENILRQPAKIKSNTVKLIALN